MAGDFKTMKLIKKLDEYDDKTAYQGVFTCPRCHGVILDTGINSFTDPSADDDSQIINWPCPLCDASAPLSRRYRMALFTVGWRCTGDSVITKTAPLGFPSFDDAYFSVVPRCDVFIVLDFNYKGIDIEASNRDISLLYQSHEDLFDDMLDGRPDRLSLETHVDRRTLAQEVVQRCLHDLRLERSQEEA